MHVHSFPQVIETLWKQRWTSVDGLGALIVSPTRELVSSNIYSVLIAFLLDSIMFIVYFF